MFTVEIKRTKMTLNANASVTLVLDGKTLDPSDPLREAVLASMVSDLGAALANMLRDQQV